jgi:hypothetical protein
MADVYAQPRDAGRSVFRAELNAPVDPNVDTEEEERAIAGERAGALTSEAQALNRRTQVTYKAHKDTQRETNLFKHPMKYFSTASPLDFPRDTFGFFFENEMAAFGMKWEGTTFPTISMEHFKKTWSESPGWNVLGLGALALMAVPPVYASFKFGTLGAKTGRGFRTADKLTDSMRRGDELQPRGAEGYRRFGTAIEDPGVQAQVMDKSQQSFYFKQFEDAATPGLRNYAEVDHLSQFWLVDDIAQMAKRYGPDDLKESLKGMDRADARQAVRDLDDNTKDLIFSQVPKDALRKARYAASSQNNWQILEAKKMLSEIEDSGVSLTGMDKARLWFRDGFANGHAQASWGFDPLAALADRGEIMTDMARRLESFNDPKIYGAMLDNLPGVRAVDNRWMEHLVYRYGADVAEAKQAAGVTEWVNKVPKPKGGLNPQEQELLDNTIGFLKERQAAMKADGFLEESTDFPWHFFAGTAATAKKTAEKGVGIKTNASLARIIDPKTGKVKDQVRMSMIPELDSPALRRRVGGTDPLEISNRLSEGKLIDNPQDLLMHSTIADGNLWEGHKLVRDMLRDEQYAAPYSALKASWDKNPATRQGWIDLNTTLPEAQRRRLARMIKAQDPNAASRILGPGDELPFLKREWYNDIFGEQNGMFAHASHSADFFDAVTTAYKTMKTAMNPTTQVTNVFGNYAFLFQAGMDPLSPTNMKFQASIAKGYHKVWKLQHKHGVNENVLGNWNKYKLADDTGRILEVDEVAAQVGKGSHLVDEYTQVVKPYLDDIKKGFDKGEFNINYRTLKDDNAMNMLALMGDDLAISAGMVSPEWRAMKEFVVTEAHGNVEMWQHMEDLYTKLSKEAARSGKGGFTKWFVEKMMKLHDPTLEKQVIAEVRQAGIKDEITGKILQEGAPKKVMGLVKGAKSTTLAGKAYAKTVTDTFNNMTHLYIQGDVIPKLNLFAHNMDQGMGMIGSINEVARRTPMYKHVGSKFKNARRYFMPWVTFPAEAARITKNNLMDHPLRMLPWLKAPQIAQYSAMQLGLLPEGMTKQGLMDAMSGTPDWIKETGAAAAGPAGQTIMFGGERGMQAASAVGGASVGAAMIGAAYALGWGGSPTTVAAKAGLSLLGGGMAGWLMNAGQEADNPDQLRATILNWLPHTAALPRGLTPGASVSDIFDVKSRSILSAGNIMPVEALSILAPLMDIAQGRDQYGNEMKSEGNWDHMTNVISSYIGTLTPPIIQKYGFKTTTPDSASYLQEVLEPAATAALGAFYGAALKGPIGAVAGGAAGAFAGSELVNTSRIYMDAGMVKNPYTDKHAATAHDLFINNLGAFKSYRVTPETDLFNRASEKEEYRAVRSYHGKNLRWALSNTQEPGDQYDVQARSLTKDVYSTFYDEYPDDPVKRMDAFEKWMKPRIGSLGSVAALRGANATDIETMMRKFSENAQVTGKQLEFWRGQLVNTLKDEQAKRVQSNVAKIWTAQGARRKKGGRPSGTGGAWAGTKLR